MSIFVLMAGGTGGHLFPAMALAQLLAQLRDKNGRIAIPGFYDDIVQLSAYERKQLARLPHQFSNVPAFRHRLASIAAMLKRVLVASWGA